MSTDVDTILSYPILTRETGDSAESAGSRSGAPASLGGTARDTIRAVLGWRYRAQDTKGFLAALRSTAVAKDVQGHREWEWRSPTFMVQADLGEITGAQASLLARVTQASGEATTLIAKLSPLEANVDEEDVAPVRAIMTSVLEELVEEAAQLGGPRVPKVDGIVWQMIGGLTAPTRPVERTDPYFDSLLGQLEQRLGLDEANVNTIDEERRYTDFILLRDLLIGIDGWWRSYKVETRRGRLGLGNLLVQMGRYLDVIVESVHEANAAMDSVFFGAAERQALRLDLTPVNHPKVKRIWAASGNNLETVTLSVSELLTWVEDYCGTEARSLIQDGGRDGVLAVCFTLARQFLLLDAAVVLSGSRRELARGGEVRGGLATDHDCGGCLGFYHPRVTRALCEVACYLLRTAQLDPGRAVLIPLEVVRYYHYAYVDTVAKEPLDPVDPRVTTAALDAVQASTQFKDKIAERVEKIEAPLIGRVFTNLKKSI